MLTTDNLLNQIRKQVLKLYSPEIQLVFEAELDKTKKEEFIQEREDYRHYLYQLELQDLQTVLLRMRLLENDLNIAIQSLDNALEDVNNTVTIISSIQYITSIMARIFTIF